ncbi:hypothetical protein GQ43DRAFT_76865 [Delitschia confertaspora ATCC 74209]|uniref:Uncharacterized protein n=1 Tax=Delitschia confertaspora ATCC 74209 TaxID=1513339 RepID=A0A9P4JJR6_9PLEO|nr:hypothetical protein GQ43DRAFT_76865 [Delitschia confertaspora ATCC 74209]
MVSEGAQPQHRGRQARHTSINSLVRLLFPATAFHDLPQYSTSSHLFNLSLQPESESLQFLSDRTTPLNTTAITMTSAIPSFYRIFFTRIDPLIDLHGAYMDFFDQSTP